MKPYRLPRRVKGKRTNKLQSMSRNLDHCRGCTIYRQGSLEYEEKAYNSAWLSVIPSAPYAEGWWRHTYSVPKAPQLIVLAFLARYKNYDWKELLDISEGLQRTFEPFEEGRY